MEKKGLLIVSFGTSYLDALERDVIPVEKAIAAAFPDHLVRRAFGSRMIIRKLRSRDGIEIPTPAEALAEFAQLGIREVLVQPTFLIHGIEYDMLTDTLRKAKDSFDSIRLGRPLLSAAEDYTALADAINTLHPAQMGTLVLMGHGTEHYANSAYPALETFFRLRGYEHVRIGAVEGHPDIDSVCRSLQQKEIAHVTLMPLMLVAGDHANNDMASDEPDSWKSILAEAGISSESVLRGLGSYPFAQEMFAQHAWHAAEI